MAKIIETKLIEYNKSTFVIDLKEHSSGQLYVEIDQTVHNYPNEQRCIKVNPFLLDGLILTLQNYQAKISEDQLKKNDPSKHNTNYKELSSKVISLYFKGISINNLAIQLGIEKNQIKQILGNEGIEIVSNEVSKYNKRKNRRNKNRF